LNQNLTRGEEYWLALARAPYALPINLLHLLNHFGNPRHIFEAEPWTWHALRLKSELIRYLKNPNWYAVENDMRWLAQSGNYLLTLYHPNYPPLLREIYDPPPVLFVQGDYLLLQTLQLAILGTRHASREGITTARKFAKYLSHQGFTITSGMALGIEAASHWGALAGTGKTIAVAAWGLDRIYPPQHLAHKILETGALVSEFPPDTAAKPKHFPLRSRIVSGLSLGTLIIDVPIRSAALHTVRFAMEQGREVFAVPGSIHNPLVKGCHQLIKQGAKLVENAEDILKELQIYMF